MNDAGATVARRWGRLRLRGRRTPEVDERLAARLLALGALGWESAGDEVRAYFDGDAARAAAEVGRDFPSLRVDTDWIDEADWEAAMRSYFEPTRVGPFVVAPPWRVPPPDDEAQVLVIEPGLAFGTGAHPTTRACLAAVGRYAAPGVRVLDLGTGSGILALAAARRGASVTALDVSDDAVAEAAKNFSANGVAVDLRRGDLGVLGSADFDLVLANLTAADLLKMAFVLPERVAVGGVLVLAGILREEEDRVRRAYERKAALQAVTREGDWVALEFVRGEAAE